jgi:hypothetical protein
MSFDISQIAGAGMDTLDEVTRMPLLKILQSNSAEIKKSHAQHATKKIEGAEEGDIILASEGLVLKGKTEFVPLAIKTIYAEWRPKDLGGGFVGHHDLRIIQSKDYKKGSERSEYDEFLGENELIFTMYIFVLVRVEDEWKKAVFAMKKTELKHGRTLQDLIRKFRYPDDEKFGELMGKEALFSRTYLVSSKADSNNAGDWYNWNIETGKILDPNEQFDIDTLELAFKSQADAIADLPVAHAPKELTAEESGNDSPF